MGEVNMRSTYGKVYFGVMVLMFLGSLFSGPDGPLDVLNTLLAAFIFVGGYGYLNSVRIGSAGIWKLYFWVFILLGIAGFLYGLVESWPELTLLALFIILFVIVLWIPLVAMLWLYAFSEPEIWSPRKTEA
jgi:hypothetical protein